MAAAEDTGDFSMVVMVVRRDTEKAVDTCTVCCGRSEAEW